MSSRSKRIEPYVRASPKDIDSIPSNQTRSANLHKSQTLVTFCLFLVVGLFAADVTYESYENYQEKFAYTEEQSKMCLTKFIGKNCLLTNLTDECESILNCVQKERAVSWAESLPFLASTFNDEVWENILLPAVVVGLLTLLYVAYELRIGLSSTKEVE